MLINSFEYGEGALNKFQINLLIPKEHTYGYISTRAGIHIYMGIFIIFFIRGGK